MLKDKINSELVQFLLLLFLGLGYWFLMRPSLSYPFEFDDYSNVVENRAIRYWNHPRVFYESVASGTRVVTSFTYALNYRISGLSLSSFRFINIFLHFLLSVVLWFCFRRILGKWTTLVFVSIFLLHPLAIETVVYISGRSVLLCALFFWCALFAFLQAQRGFLFYFSFLGFAALALASKENAIALPLFLIAFNHFEKRRIRELIPYFIPILIGVVFLALKKKSFFIGAMGGYFSYQGEKTIQSFSEFATMQVSIWPRMLSFLVNPTLYSIDHLVFSSHYQSFPILLWGVVCIVGFSVLVGLFYKKNRLVFLAPSLLFFSLLPTNSIFPVLDPLAERHLYFALPSFALFLAVVLSEFWNISSRLVYKSGVVLFGVLFLGLVLPIFRGNLERWSTSAKLWESARQKYPEKIRIQINAIQALYLERDIEPEEFFRKIGTQFWESATFEELEILTNFGGNLLSSIPSEQRVSAVESWMAGDKEKEGNGIDSLLLDLSLTKSFYGILSPADFEAWVVSRKHRLSEKLPRIRIQDPNFNENIWSLYTANFYYKKNNWQEAKALYERVFQQFSDLHFPYWILRENYADSLYELHEAGKAAEQYNLLAEQFKIFKRFSTHAHERIYELQFAMGDYYRAADALKEMLRLRPDSVELRNKLIELFKKLNPGFLPQLEAERDYYVINARLPDDERESIQP